MKVLRLFFLTLSFSLSSCDSVQECAAASFDFHKKAVIAYVEHSSYPRLKGATAADVVFEEESRKYGKASGFWTLNFKARGERYIAMIGCNGSVELSKLD
ncbi:MULTISPECIES: hypothetical protein [Xanthomonas]|uniref:hypothetical protein n=1 Tax=Xanthomonas TaxID=338 RepID=UPI000C3DDA6D|nr:MULTISPECIES: hypothetical protein [Xanthomonas]QTD87993.1 hypothetical protein XcfCFBP6988P_23425 [Xanthomonas citri pv. phaseoli var. fuscans]QTF14074.1 hypothetical protein XcfCFBP6989P_23340 [Xanthomonas citri pv. phaseoli var. fuscans]QTF14298.1 hypothetical protein XcfCFBP6991P_24075 [Xanthomonas citri pv. phaseoli var. fuscans]QTF76274.1 hypothetical protein XcfCFBP6990P_23370 [Xanthomonas citri pv. phaseoli var. fuscans]UZB00221.1 hypothetical protein OM946_02920 [Xanthomonas citri 